jgi:hypothetical protein
LTLLTHAASDSAAAQRGQTFNHYEAAEQLNIDPEGSFFFGQNSGKVFFSENESS